MAHDSPFTTVLSGGRQLYVGLTTKAGVHVTPELYVWSDDALWFLAASSTLKARKLDEGDRLGVLVRSEHRSVVAMGDAEVFRLRRAVLPRSLVAAPAMTRALGRYALRNAADLAAFVGDTARGRLGWGIPPGRILFRVVPDRMALLDTGAVTAADGGWPLPPATDPATSSGGVTDAEPGGSAVLAWLTAEGPLLVPARWDPEAARAVVPAAPMVMAAAATSARAAVVVDEYRQPGPAAKQGELLRGQGRVVDRQAGTWTVELDFERATEWNGVRATSSRA